MKRKGIINLARELRKNQTQEENLMWNLLRNRKFEGKKFLRQHPIIINETFDNIDFYIADFYCHEHKLVLEIDGKIHDFQKKYDQHRDSVMNELGLTVFRIKNEDVISDINKVKQEFKKYF